MSLAMLACSGTLSCELLISNNGLSDGTDGSPPASDSQTADASPPDSDLTISENTPEPSDDAIVQRDDGAPTGDVVVTSWDGPSEEAAPEAMPAGMVDGPSGNVDAGGVAFVQFASTTPSGFVQSAAATFPRAQSAGDLNVVVVGWGDSTDTVTRISDTAGNSYDLAVGPTRTTGVSQSIYYAKSIAAAAANAVQVQFKIDAPRVDMRVVEYAEIDLVAPLDAVAGQSGFGGVPTSGEATTHSAGEIIFGAGTTTDAFSDAGLPFTLRILTTYGDIVEDRPVGSAGVYSADAEMMNWADWVMQAVTFRRR